MVTKRSGLNLKTTQLLLCVFYVSVCVGVCVEYVFRLIFSFNVFVIANIQT